MGQSYKSVKKNFIIVVILVMTIISLIGATIERYFEEMLVSDYRKESLEVSSHMAKAIDEHLTSKIKELEFLAGVVVEKVGDDSTFEFDILNQDLSSEIFNALYLAKADGTVRSTDGIERNYGDRSFFRLAMSGRSNISNPITSQFDSKRIIVYAVPIQKDNQVIGVLCGRNTVEELNKIILSQMYGSSTDVYVVGDNGEVILSNNYDNNFVVNSFNDYYINLSAPSNSQYILSTNHSQSIEWEDNYGNTSYINYQKIDNVSDWYILTTANPEVLATKIQHMKQLTWCVVILINILFLCIYYYVIKIKKDNLEYIKRLAFYDSVTGLLNNNGFMKKVESVLKRSNQTYYSLVVFDLESFKLINEIYGYSKGDQLLKEIAFRLKAEFHPSTIFGRLSNDVFILMLDTRIKYEEKLIPATIQSIVNLASQQIIENPLNASIGMYYFDNSELNIQRAIDHADMARLHAKKNLSKRYYLFDDKLFKNKMDLKLIEQEIKPSLISKHFQVFYQPKVNPCTEEIVGAEALVRWFHPDRGFISPALFIPIAEKSGDIITVGRWVFNEVCSMLAQQKEKGIESIPISINLSRVELYQSDLILFLKSVISRYQIDPCLIEVEITETTALNDVELINEKIKAIHELGMKVSMDDFGTGSSTFSNLKQVDIDILKIDRSFLCDIETNFKSKELVHGIIDLAKRIGVAVVCEGVEVQEQVKILKEMRCDLIQGYVYAKPMPRSEFEDKIQRDDFL